MASTEDYAFTLNLEVRDYECDLQGIVNNGVYFNYLEHVRHQYLRSVGIDFAAYAELGINLVVVRAELDYRSPLRSGDRFWVGVNVARESKVRFAFLQDIFLLADTRPVLNAKITGAALNARGRPMLPEAMERLLARPDE